MFKFTLFTTTNESISYLLHIGGDLAPSLGDGKKCRGPNFWM